MSHVLSCQNFLHLLCETKSKKKQKGLIKFANLKQINAICEVVLNILNGNINIEEDTYKKLKSKRQVLRELVDKVPLYQKKYLLQKGGFLQFIIPSIISGLATVVASLIDKK